MIRLKKPSFIIKMVPLFLVPLIMLLCRLRMRTTLYITLVKPLIYLMKPMCFIAICTIIVIPLVKLLCFVGISIVIVISLLKTLFIMSICTFHKDSIYHNNLYYYVVIANLNSLYYFTNHSNISGQSMNTTKQE